MLKSVKPPSQSPLRLQTRPTVRLHRPDHSHWLIHLHRSTYHYLLNRLWAVLSVSEYTDILLAYHPFARRAELKGHRGELTGKPDRTKRPHHQPIKDRPPSCTRTPRAYYSTGDNDGMSFLSKPGRQGVFRDPTNTFLSFSTTVSSTSQLSTQTTSSTTAIPRINLRLVYL